MSTFLIALAILAALACVACTLTMVAVTWKLYDMMKDGQTDEDEEDLI